MLEIMWDASAFDLDYEAPGFSVFGVPLGTDWGISWVDAAAASVGNELPRPSSLVVGHLNSGKTERFLIPSNNCKNRIHIYAKPVDLFEAAFMTQAARSGSPIQIGGVYVIAVRTNYADGALFFIGKPASPKNPNAVITEQLSARPPLGLKPEKIWKAQRAHEIHGAIGRYLQADKRVPSEWYDELKKLTNELEV